MLTPTSFKIYQIETKDHLRLTGLLQEGDMRKPAVIYIHGFTSDFYTHRFPYAISKKLKQNKMSVNKVTIFISGNRHKGQGHYQSKTIGLTNATQNDVEIWSQIESHLNKMYSKSKQYKKCGILFQELIPENTNQMSLFSENIKLVQPPINRNKKWEMRQDFISNKFTTSWDELPIVFQ